MLWQSFEARYQLTNVLMMDYNALNRDLAAKNLQIFKRRQQRRSLQSSQFQSGHPRLVSSITLSSQKFNFDLYHVILLGIFYE